MTTNLSNVAKQVGVSENALQRNIDEVVSSNAEAWTTAGISSDDQQTRAIRIAARQLVTKSRAIASSGCVELKGVFVSSPPYKDWAKMAYTKMSKTLDTLDSDQLLSLVNNGTLVTFKAEGDSYVRNANASLMNKSAFSEGHKVDNVAELPDNTMHNSKHDLHFYLVADNKMHKWPSGDANFRYGAPRYLSEPERTCLFLGSLDGGDVQLVEVKFSGNDALPQQPTFVPGMIPVKAGKPSPKTGNGRAYAKRGVSSFNEDEECATLLPSAPFDGKEGFIASLPNLTVLESFNDLLPYYDANNGADGWWDMSVGVKGEVGHIDILENGGATIVVGDLLDFTAPSIEVRIPKEQVHLIDFAVGSSIIVTGGVWKTNDGEPRLSVSGWFVYESIAPSVTAAQGWDA